jgi:hypothetical protein
LAGESAGEHVDGREVVGADLADILVLPGVRESIGEDGPADRVDFDLPGGFKPRLLEADIEATDAGEQTSDCERAFTTGLSRLFPGRIHPLLSWLTLQGVLFRGS